MKRLSTCPFKKGASWKMGRCENSRRHGRMMIIKLGDVVAGQQAQMEDIRLKLLIMVRFLK